MNGRDSLERLRRTVAAGGVIMGAGAGTGLSAKCAEAGGADLIIYNSGRAVKPDIMVLCHGGPIAEPEDAQYVIDHATGAAGFFGASSMERLPTEIAITENVRRFKRISRHRVAAS